MSALCFFTALFFITVGHWFRCMRWKNLLSVYEDVPFSRLMYSMSLGYMVDLLFPFHVGDIVRAINCGKALKNKSSFGFATIIFDRLLDVHIVTIIYTLLFAIGYGSLRSSLVSYVIIAGIITFLIAWALAFGKSLKHLVLATSSLFNSKIELWLLSFFWAFMCTADGIANKLKKPILLFNTTIMWLCYITAYYFIGCALNGENLSMVFDRFFSPNSNLSITLIITHTESYDGNTYYYLVFNVLSTLMLLLSAFIETLIFKKKNNTKKTSPNTELIIPYSSEANKYDFLKIYFSDVRDKRYINSFLEINKDVTIIRNCSAGSNATTLLCIKMDQMIYRKYTLGTDSHKLFEQINWIKDNSISLFLPTIIDSEYLNEVCWYDMPYHPNSSSFFDYIHSSTLKESEHILFAILDDLNSFYAKTKIKKADRTTIEKYYNEKIVKNVKTIVESGRLKNLMPYNELIINGKKYKSLSYYLDRILSFDYWYNIFANDTYSLIHGDLTVENIICNKDYAKDYYLIDPNGGNIHSSPNLDYGKLLQSLHGSYEFFMKSEKASVSGNVITFNIIRSSSYDALFKSLKKYMEKTFPTEQIVSIFHHELIHWFRLMPYKINNDSERAVLFYSGMIMVLNDIIKEEQ